MVLHAQHIFANSFNLLVTGELPVTIFHSMCIFCVYSMALYWPTRQFGMCRPLVSVIITLYYVPIIFHRRVWYRVLSLRYACIQSSGIILIPYANFVPNFISFVASIAELAHREKLHIQSPSLFDAPGTKDCTSEKTFLLPNSVQNHGRMRKY